jgi:post-segregation antitoxin (ccd killing protein)
MPICDKSCIMRKKMDFSDIPKKPDQKIRLVVRVDRDLYNKARELRIDLQELVRWRIAEAVDRVEKAQGRGFK